MSLVGGGLKSSHLSNTVSLRRRSLARRRRVGFGSSISPLSCRAVSPGAGLPRTTLLVTAWLHVGAASCHDAAWTILQLWWRECATSMRGQRLEGILPRYLAGSGALVCV